MRVSFITTILAFVASRVVAQDSTCLFCNQSAPFNLVLRSAYSNVSGTSLSACHVGAGIEALCLVTDFTPPDHPASFYLNYSSFDTPDPKLGYAGLLTYNFEYLGGNGVGFFNEPMTLTYGPTSNVALPLFGAGSTVYSIGFDQHNHMYIVGNDDTVSPPQFKSKAYYRWYACVQSYLVDPYNVLSWVIGKGKSENLSCVKVDVERVFI